MQDLNEDDVCHSEQDNLGTGPALFDLTGDEADVLDKTNGGENRA